MDDLVALKQTRDAQVYMDDSIEFFLDTRYRPGCRGYHTIGNAFGTAQYIHYFNTAGR